VIASALPLPDGKVYSCPWPLVASYDKLRNLVNQIKDLNIMGLASVILFLP
jgi:hypothetical protein